MRDPLGASAVRYEAFFSMELHTEARCFILEVSTADEVALVNTLNGADLYARAAAGTERVVDGREIVLNGDSTLRTGLLTLHTADTAVGAILTGESTLILVGALNYYAGSVVDKMNDTVGALAHADATADTLLRINSCYTVLYGDSVLRTNYGTVTVAEAGEGTELVAAVRHICGAAGLVTLVVVLSCRYVASAVAGNVSNSFHYVGSLNAEDSRDVLCGAVTAGNAEVGFVGSLVSESLCISVTARVAARATVSAGQTVTDSNGGFILFYSEEYAG